MNCHLSFNLFFKYIFNFHSFWKTNVSKESTLKGINCVCKSFYQCSDTWIAQGILSTVIVKKIASSVISSTANCKFFSDGNELRGTFYFFINLRNLSFFAYVSFHLFLFPHFCFFFCFVIFINFWSCFLFCCGFLGFFECFWIDAVLLFLFGYTLIFLKY